MTPQEPVDLDHSKVNRKLFTTRSPTGEQTLRAWSGSTRTFLKASATWALLVSILSTGNFFVRVTSSSRNLASACTHRHWRTVSGSVSPLNPPSSPDAANRTNKSFTILTLYATTAAKGDTLRWGISCAADFCMTKHFCRLHSSPLFFPGRWQMLVDTGVVSVLHCAL